MPKIIIKEADYTGELTAEQLYDVAYIPGFSINEPGDDTYTLGEPTLYTSVVDFETAIGHRPFDFGDEVPAILAWNSNKFYTEYEIVISNNNYYVAKVANIGWYEPEEWSGGEYGAKTVVYVQGTPNTYYRATVATQTSPTDGESDWEVVDSQPYNTSTTYVEGDVVVKDGTTYAKSEIKTPANDTDWSTNTIDSWDDDGSYSEFALVGYDGTIYTSRINSNLGNNPSTSTNAWTTNEVDDAPGTYAEYGVDVSVDTAYIYAHTFLELGMPIYYEVVSTIDGGDTKCRTISEIYGRFGGKDNIFDKIADKGAYSIKYITTGGYPIYKDDTTNLINERDTEKDSLIGIIQSAASRADAYALVDHVQGLPVDKTNQNSAFYTINKSDINLTTRVSWADGSIDAGSYATMLTPWQLYKLTTSYLDGDEKVIKDPFELPASFGYLVCVANSIKNNPAWLAIAGVTRGLVPYRNNEKDVNKDQKPTITNKVADSYMTYGGKDSKDTGRSINGITNIRPYGLTIWGNRTLINNTTENDTQALAYLNIRNMTCDVKKRVFAACQKWMFEQNNEVLWINFKSDITPLLDRMATSGGISGYKIIKQKCKNSAKLCATIVLYPIYAVEEIEVSIELRNEEITVA